MALPVLVAPLGAVADDPFRWVRKTGTTMSAVRSDAEPGYLLGMMLIKYDHTFRCYAERKGDQWQAFCVDLCLAAQADTLGEARKKLESMVEEYVEDALSGEDKAHAEELLNRKTTLRERLKYRFLAMFRIFGFRRAVWVIEK